MVSCLVLSCLVLSCLVSHSDEWFLQRQLNASSHTARQGYKGTRWGKMLGESNMHGLGKGPKALM